MNDKSILQGSLTTINQQTNLMKQCLADNNLLPALKHCSNFLNELRINSLSPKQYYELYISIFDSLEILSNYLLNHYKKRPQYLSDLYELVQYSGNIIPRLYMMISIGTTYITTNKGPTEDLMKDMIEMCRGIQNPIRGLFLRYYLSQRIKNHLPINDLRQFNLSVEFLITNFIEMNKLWVRLQHQGHSSEREIRLTERKELKILVGNNLVRLSQIIDDFNFENYSSSDFYKQKIFPIIIEQIIQCKDNLAQIYLIDVIIQIFPINFHFNTLNELLNSFLKLNPLINKSELIITLIERFINSNNNEISDINYDLNKLFDDFWYFFNELTKSNLSNNEIYLILINFIKLSNNFDKDNFDNIEKIYQYSKLLENDNVEDIWLNLLLIPIKQFDIIKLISLENFNKIFMSFTNQSFKIQICNEILNQLLEYNIKINSYEDIDRIFQYLILLIDDKHELNVSKQIGIVKTFKINDKLITNNFLDNQNKICKILHKINRDINFTNIDYLIYIKKKYLSKNNFSIILTYPTLIQILLNNLKIFGKICGKNDKFNKKLVNYLKVISIILDELYEYHGDYYSDLVINLYLNLSIISDELNFPNLTFEIFNKIFIIFEERIIVGQGSTINLINKEKSENSLDLNSIQYQTILLIINKLLLVKNLSTDNFQILVTKITLYGTKLLKKNDQCRSIINCCHLFWCSGLKLENLLFECLQKSLTLADSCINPYLSIKLFIEILNKCLIFDDNNELVNLDYINKLIELIRNHLDSLVESNNLKDTDDDEFKLFVGIKSYFNRTLNYIEYLKD